MKRIHILLAYMVACAPNPAQQRVQVTPGQLSTFAPAAGLVFRDFFDSTVASQHPEWRTEWRYVDPYYTVQTTERHDTTWLEAAVASGRVRGICSRAHQPKCPVGANRSTNIYYVAMPAFRGDTVAVEVGQFQPPIEGGQWGNKFRVYTLVFSGADWQIIDRGPVGHDN